MNVELTYPHIEKRENEPAHLRRIPRIRVAQIVMDYLGYGWSAEEMCRQYPYLRPAEAHAALTYYYDHLDEIEEEIEAETRQAEEERQKAVRSPFFMRMRTEEKLETSR